MKKGIVMQIEDTQLTLLTPDGQFMQARRIKDQYELGEEILFTPLERSKKIASVLPRLLTMKPLLAGVAVLLLLIGSFLSIFQSNKAYAYMSIDANPSIEMELNHQMQVIKLTPFNANGKKVLSEIGNWKNKQVDDIAQSILEHMKKEGYLKNNRLVILSTVRTEKADEKAENQLIKNINVIKTIVAEDHLKLAVLSGTKAEMEKAHKLGMTTGKYKETQLPLQQNREKSQNLQESQRSQTPVDSQTHEQTQPDKKFVANHHSFTHVNEPGNTEYSGNHSIWKLPEKRAVSNRTSTEAGSSTVQKQKTPQPVKLHSKKVANVQKKAHPASSNKKNAVTNYELNWGQMKKNSGYLNWGQAKKYGMEKNRYGQEHKQN